jgi:hypothetical protein
MNQSSINADSYPLPTSEPAKIGWGFIIFLTFTGFLSGAFTFVLIGFLTSSWLKGNFWFVLLGGASFGLSLAAAFWFSGKIGTWRKFFALTCATIIAHLAGLVPLDHLPQGTLNHDLNPFGVVPIFLATLIFFVVVPVVISPNLNLRRLVLIALACATLGTVTFGFAITATEHDPTVFLFLPLGVLWQMSLSLLLGIALRAQHSRLRSAIPEVDRVDLREYRLAGFGVLLAYFVLLGLLCRSAELGEMKKRQDVADSIAQSLAEAPSLLNLPELVPVQIDHVLLMNEIGGWTPSLASSEVNRAQLGGPNLAPCPPSISYRVSYGNQSSADGVRATVTVTDYPNFEWAKYQVRNTPMPNELIQDPDHDLKVIRFGSVIYQEGPYFFWSSGNRLIFLSLQGDSSKAEDEFLKAYLEKYPSSI